MPRMPTRSYPSVFQPTDRSARVEHRLPHRLNRAPDVGADEMIRAFEFGRLSLLVIRKRQSQRRHSDHVEDAAGFNVTFRLCIPLRQNNDCVARFLSIPAFFRKEPRARHVVFDRRCVYRAGPG